MATPKKRTKRGWQRDRTGCVVVQFTAPDGKRRTLRLGNIPDKDATRHVSMLQTLIATLNVGGTSDAKLTAQIESWLAGIGPKIGDRLVEFGLLRPLDAPESTQLGPFLTRYLGSRTEVKPGTTTFYEHTERNLLTFFGPERESSTITKLNAIEFRAYLLRPKPEKPDGLPIEARGEGLATNTMRRRVSMASQFFAAAVDGKIIDENPFRGLCESVRANKDRMFYVVEANALKVLEACPSMEWKIVFALARWGGLRTPSEIDGLKWEHIDWANQQMLIHSPKTEHYEGKDARWMPLYNSKHPELWSVLPNLLRDAFEQAEPGSVHVLNRLRGHTNLGTTMRKIIKRAGVAEWEKVFQNLRSTRATELIDSYPIQNVAEWMGHSPAMLLKHYAQLRTAMFEAQGRAVADDRKEGLAMVLQSGTGGEGQDGSGEKKKPAVTRAFAESRDFANSSSGQYRTRTCDPYRVKIVL